MTDQNQADPSDRFDPDDLDELDDPDAPRHRKVRRTRRSKPVLWGQSATDLAIIAISVASGVAAAFAAGQATSTPVVDVVLRVGFGAGIAFVTPRARRWTWLVLAGVAVAASGLHAEAVGAWIALAVALASTWTARQRWLGAVVGATAAWSLLRLPELGPHGTTALIVAASVVPVLVSAYRRERRSVRKRVVRVLVATAGLAVVAVGLLGVAGLLSVDDLNRGVDEARAGIAAAKTGDNDSTDVHLAASVAAFDAANGRLGSWMTLPARAVPIVGQHANALATMSGVGEDLATLARDTTTRADYRGITLTDGRVDIAAITGLEAPLQSIDDGLATASERSAAVQADWLVGPLREQYDSLEHEIASTSDEVDVALQAVRVAPGLLGADGPRRYFIAFTTPAEARGLGGFMGNWAELTAVDGELDIARDGRIADLLPREGEPPRTLEAPPDYLARYGALHPETFPGDFTFSPDFPSDAQAIASIYRQVDGGGPVDGVIAIDPYGLAAMLEITGPIPVEGRSEPLTAANAAQYLLKDQYLDYDTREERIDVLDEASQTTFDAFIHSGKLQPARLAAVLAPAVADGRIVASSNDADEASFIDRLGLSGAFPAPSTGDFFALVTQNGGNNKIDAYLNRSIDYRASFEPETGAVDATATINLRNDAPPAGLPDYVIGNRESSGQPDGTNWAWFNFYSPHQLLSMTVNGEQVALGAHEEFGMFVYETYVAVPPQGQTEITLHLSGQIEPSATYEVGWYQQALTNPDQVRVYLAVAAPWYVDVPGTPAGDVPLISTEPNLVTSSRQDGELEIPLRDVST
jgi:hypothetical protein